MSDLIDQLSAATIEGVCRFKIELASLVDSGRFVDWRGSASFSRELRKILQDLKAGVDDPLIGAQLVAEFFEADDFIFGMCDDSNGDIGDVFRLDAKSLFADYASRCASECLPDGYIRTMMDSLWEMAAKEENADSKRLRTYRSVSNLNALLDVIGHEKRNEVVSNEVRQIFEDPSLNLPDAEFLIEMGKTDDAEDYLLKRADQLNGIKAGFIGRSPSEKLEP